MERHAPVKQDGLVDEAPDCRHGQTAILDLLQRVLVIRRLVLLCHAKGIKPKLPWYVPVLEHVFHRHLAL